MTSPFPTQSDPLNSPKGMLYRAILGESTDSIIMRQEAQGQRELGDMDVLPKKMEPWQREKWEAAGFEFGAEADDIFNQARLPAGWSKQPTDHSMWTRVVDAQGRERAMIFYKAAFYDRSAHMSASRRFHVTPYHGDMHAPTRTVVVIDKGVPGPVDGGTIAWESEPFDNPSNIRGNDDLFMKLIAVQDEAEKQARKWLEEHYPDNNDPFAYWD